MKKMYMNLKTLVIGAVLLGCSFTSWGQIPGIKVQAFGPDKVVVRWNRVTNAAKYYLEISTNGTTWNSAGETTDTVKVFTDLTPSTSYSFVVGALDAGGVELAESVVKRATIAKKLITHLPLNDLVSTDKIKNVITDSLDVKSNGMLTIVDYKNSGLGIPVTKFTGTTAPPVASWVRLWKTVQGFDSAYVGRTVSLWFKNESPSKNATIISFGKRSGLSLTIKNNKLHALTKIWTDFGGDGNKYWADSTGVDFTSNQWTHVAYVFDHPYTSLYINGVLVDKSDGIGFYAKTNLNNVALPWPAQIEINEPTNGNGRSAELGCLYEPCAAMVKYLGDTWDAGAHTGYAFNGMMSNVRLYNYAQTAQEIISTIAPAPTGLKIQAFGTNDLVLRWNGDTTLSYQISKSTDGVAWTILDTVSVDNFNVEGLDPGKSYQFKVVSMRASVPGDGAVITGKTTVKRLAVHFPLSELVGGDKIENVVSDSLDVKSNGQLAIVDAATSGLGVAVTKFTGTTAPPVASWVRLWKTVQGYDSAYTGRTISLWFKNESPTKNTVLISFGKRSGMTLALKDGKMFGLTKIWTDFLGDGGKWWADSTGTDFNSGEWTHVAYVFDNPVTRLYINGVLKDESDGKGYFDKTKQADLLLPWPSQIEINEPTNGNGRSAEIGCLFEPCAAMVKYLGDTWDAGAHTSYAFNGMMSNVRMHNYALTADEIKAQYGEFAKEMKGLKVASFGPTDLTLKWNNIAGNTGYKVQKSENGTTWSDVETLAANDSITTVTGLTAGTKYFFKVIPQGASGMVSGNEVSDTTLLPGMVVHFEFADAITSGVKNSVDNSVDNQIFGTVTTADIPSSDLVVLDKNYNFAASTGAITFAPVATPPVNAYARLEKSVQAAMKSMNHRSVTFWVKNEDPSKFAVPFSVDKRSGITFAFKDNKVFAFTKFWENDNGSNWYADSIGVAYTGTGWNHIAYVFNTPVSKLYINGTLVATSDGKFYNDLAKKDIELPNPSEWYNIPGQQKSAEMGSLYDPCVALVKYLGDNWNGGDRNAFKGSLSDFRIYNYGLSDSEIGEIMKENLVVNAVDEFTSGNYAVYPNPVSGTMYFRNAVNAEVSIMDNVGKVLIRTRLNTTDNINVSSLTPGLYYVRISGKQGSELHKISVVK